MILGKWFPTFLEIVVPSFLRMLVGLCETEDERIAVLLNLGRFSPKNSGTHTRRLEFSYKELCVFKLAITAAACSEKLCPVVTS